MPNRSVGPVSKEFISDAETHNKTAFQKVGCFHSDLLIEWALSFKEGPVLVRFIHTGESGLLIGNDDIEDIAVGGLVE